MFIINVDHITEPEDAIPSRKGLKSHNYKEGTELLHKWRVMDGDGEIYYEGLSDDDSSFEPLDFATADAGCVSIEYYNPTTGFWEEL